MSIPATINTQKDRILSCLDSLKNICRTQEAETLLARAFQEAPEAASPDSPDFTDVFNAELYRYVVKQYREGCRGLCIWRFIKRLTPEQLAADESARQEILINDALFRFFLYSEPLDDLTCLFIPVSEEDRIKQYLYWIKNHYYNADYPTSLLWLYALDSSLASLLPDEIIYFGIRKKNGNPQIMNPDFTKEEAVLIKRYSNKPDHFVHLTGKNANDEFRQLFDFLDDEFRDRCLSRTGSIEDYADRDAYLKEWEKFEDVLKFGVSDKLETGCVSFSDMRASTEFLNAYGKSFYLNKIQQPFFENTRLISKNYNGRIDKFMGDNVMCVFLAARNGAGLSENAAVNNFMAIYDLCRVLNGMIDRENLEGTRLGLRSGMTYGDRILRSNLGNEFVRDFTVTGESVNLAARLEHIGIHELRLHNNLYFKDAVERFPQVSKLMTVCGDMGDLNDETRDIIRRFTLCQNIDSNLESLEKVRFDIRFNRAAYLKLRDHFLSRGFQIKNLLTSEAHGFEEFDIDGFSFKFYFMFYNPKGFSRFERIRILPIETETLHRLDLRPLL